MKKILLFSLLCGVVFASCNNDWDDHFNEDGYDITAEGNDKTEILDVNLSEFIASHTEYSNHFDFFNLVERTSAEIAKPQMMTLWVVNNDNFGDNPIGLTSLDTLRTAVLHMNNIPYDYGDLANGQKLTAVSEAPAKTGYVLTITKNEIYPYPGVKDSEVYVNLDPALPLDENSKLVKSYRLNDGTIVHELSRLLTASVNLYEYIQLLGDEYSIIRDSILARDIKMFNRANSKAIGVDETGNTIYDSAFDYWNSMFGNYNADNLQTRFNFNHNANQLTFFLASNDVIEAAYEKAREEFALFYNVFDGQPGDIDDPRPKPDKYFKFASGTETTVDRGNTANRPTLNKTVFWEWMLYGTWFNGIISNPAAQTIDATRGIWSTRSVYHYKNNGNMTGSRQREFGWWPALFGWNPEYQILQSNEPKVKLANGWIYEMQQIKLPKYIIQRRMATWISTPETVNQYVKESHNGRYYSDPTLYNLLPDDLKAQGKVIATLPEPIDGDPASRKWEIKVGYYTNGGLQWYNDDLSGFDPNAPEVSMAITPMRYVRNGGVETAQINYLPVGEYRLGLTAARQDPSGGGATSDGMRHNYTWLFIDFFDGNGYQPVLNASGGQIRANSYNWFSGYDEDRMGEEFGPLTIPQHPDAPEGFGTFSYKAVRDRAQYPDSYTTGVSMFLSGWSAVMTEKSY